MSGSYYSLIGRKVGLLTVVSIDSSASRAYAVCDCDCGNTKRVRCDHIQHEETKSCGCEWHSVHRKHGMFRSKEYGIWNSMRERCRNPNAKYYDQYGGRGIKVCARWDEDFSAFYADMGPRPSAKHSIDRIDNDDNYEPGNCRWATRAIQANNTRRNRYVDVDGKRLTVAEAARHHGISWDRAARAYGVGK